MGTVRGRAVKSLVHQNNDTMGAAALAQWIIKTDGALTLSTRYMKDYLLERSIVDTLRLLQFVAIVCGDIEWIIDD